MEKITVKIDGMMCGMCESHMNDTFRQNFKVKKVSSSHAKGETVAIVDEDIPDEKLKEAVEKQATLLFPLKESLMRKKDFCKIQVNSYAQKSWQMKRSVTAFFCLLDKTYFL